MQTGIGQKSKATEDPYDLIGEAAPEDCANVP